MTDPHPHPVAVFDGRPEAELTFRDQQPLAASRIVWAADEFGYRIRSHRRYGRDSYQLTFARDDSPPARRRAQQAALRMRQQGTWQPIPLPPHTLPPSDPSFVHPLTAAQARRQIAMYEGWRMIPLIVMCGAAALGLLVLALRTQETTTTCWACAGAAVCLAGAVAGPVTTRRALRRNERTAARFRSEQAARQAPLKS